MNERYLCAYLVTNNNNTNKLNYKEELTDNLPEYMIPDYFIELDYIPLTSNGKIDKRALLEIEINLQDKRDYDPPRNDFEEYIAAIWKTVLNKDKIGINDNFFEISGNSLNVLNVFNKFQNSKEYQKKLKIIKIIDLFNYRTISDLVDFIEEKEANVKNIDKN